MTMDHIGSRAGEVLPMKRRNDRKTRFKLPASPDLLTVPDVAALLRCTVGAVYVRHSRRMLPGALRVHGRVLFDRATLVAWLEDCRVASLEDER